jgi:SHS2 domain-containing protein
MRGMQLKFEILEHPSDLGIKAQGDSLQNVFCNAAFGLMSVVAGASAIEPRESREVSVSAIDRENMLVRWLTEILYLFDAEKFLTGEIKFTFFSDTALTAHVRGETYDAGKHELKLDVKAITYHQLKIEECDGRWTARVFVDI